MTSFHRGAARRPVDFLSPGTSVRAGTGTMGSGRAIVCTLTTATWSGAIPPAVQLLFVRVVEAGMAPHQSSSKNIASWSSFNFAERCHRGSTRSTRCTRVGTCYRIDCNHAASCVAGTIHIGFEPLCPTDERVAPHFEVRAPFWFSELFCASLFQSSYSCGSPGSSSWVRESSSPSRVWIPKRVGG